jgi:hypothetical protein
LSATPLHQEVINTPDNLHHPDSDLQEAAKRHDDAFAVIRPLTDALNVVPAMCSEIRALRRRLSNALIDLSDLIAAGVATIGAHADGEPDPLYYLRDQLQALGYLRQDAEQRPSHTWGGLE